MKEEVLLGKMAALIELVENNTKKNLAAQFELTEATFRLEAASREVQDLRALVIKMERILSKNSQIDWLTSTQLAEKLGVVPRTIRLWHEAGIIPGYKMSEGGHLRFDLNEVSLAIKMRDTGVNEKTPV